MEIKCTAESKRVGKKETNTQEFLYWFGNNPCLHPVLKQPAVLEISFNLVKILLQAKIHKVMQAPLELVGLGSSSSMDSFASWKINGSGMEKEEREETPLQGEDESRRSSPP